MKIKSSSHKIVSVNSSDVLTFTSKFLKFAGLEIGENNTIQFEQAEELGLRKSIVTQFINLINSVITLSQSGNTEPESISDILTVIKKNHLGNTLPPAFSHLKDTKFNLQKANFDKSNLAVFYSKGSTVKIVGYLSEDKSIESKVFDITEEVTGEKLFSYLFEPKVVVNEKDYDLTTNSLYPEEMWSEYGDHLYSLSISNGDGTVEYLSNDNYYSITGTSTFPESLVGYRGKCLYTLLGNPYIISRYYNDIPNKRNILSKDYFVEVTKRYKDTIFNYIESDSNNNFYEYLFHTHYGIFKISGLADKRFFVKQESSMDDLINNLHSFSIEEYKESK